MNPPGSTSPYDLFDNSQNFDTAINSITAAIWQDRLGKSRHTWYGIESLALISMLNYGYITKKSFEQGATLDTPNTVLQLESNGEHYRWDGDWSQPKVVPPGSTPESAGGVGPGKWVGVGDASLRGQLSDQDGVEKYPEIQMSRWRDEGDIRGWGAIGDADEAGTSGRDDTAAIQAALNSGKKKLKIPANHYFLVTQTLVVPSGISLVGEDQFSSCIVAAPSMDGILDVMHNAGYNAPTVKYDRNIVFSNFRIHANGFSRVKSDPDVEWGRCLRTGALKGLSINKMVFQEGPQHCLDIACWKDAYIGVGHAGAIPGMTTDARVTDSYLIDYCYDDGLTTHGADGVTVSNCTAMITDYAKSRHVQV
ncbi:hypothetical protein K5P63_004040, partial [Escherichia coli]|nr:hypothetical protein [Escherichia coli]